MDSKAYREMAEVEGRHWWFVSRRRIVRAVLSSLRLPAKPRLLEFGTGTGHNLPMLAELGEVTALEPEPWARQLAAERVPGSRVVETMQELSGEKFDAILLLDVMEHLDEPATILRELRGLLAPGAPLVLTVPAHAWLYGAHDRFLHHHRRYSAKVLREHLRRGGFTVSYLSAMNAISLLPAIAMRTVEALRSPDSQAQSRGMGILPGPLNALLGACFAAERHLIPSRTLPLGLSWIAVAHASAGETNAG